jgi:hypothetical protein
MIKNIVELEVKVAEKIYRFICDNDSPIPEVKEAIFQLTKIVAAIEEKSMSAIKKPEEPYSEMPTQESEER